MMPRRPFEMWTWFLSFGFLAYLQQFIPPEYTDLLRRNLRIWLQKLTPYIYCDVHEFDSTVTNTLYPDVQIYLSSLTAEAAQRLNLSKPKSAKEMTFSMANDQRTEDKFENAKLEWVHHVYDRPRGPMWTNWETQSDEKRTFTLQVNRKDKDRILVNYLKHIQAKAKELRRASRDLKLYTNCKGKDYYSKMRPWESVPFLHPATFDTLGLDGDLRAKIELDLETFSRSEEFYRRVGKAWKRGYLLYGPPGTGKSSMIAAIANKMKYDIYDLELTEVQSNIDLRKLLLHTSNKSVIVIEDIDCSLDLSGQRKKKKKKPPVETPNSSAPNAPRIKEESKVTLSGLLNFVDGLWSSCGSERIFIFTTNYVEKLDPALLRAGRMDMHINLSYCTFSAFQVLAKNYLEITDHALFDKVKRTFQGTFMTPAEVTEVLIQNQDDVAAGLEKLIRALDEHRVEPVYAAPDSDTEDDPKDAEKDDKKETKTADSDKKDAEATDSEKKEEAAPEKSDATKNVEDDERRKPEREQVSPSSVETIHKVPEPDRGKSSPAEEPDRTADLELTKAHAAVGAAEANGNHSTADAGSVKAAPGKAGGEESVKSASRIAVAPQANGNHSTAEVESPERSSKASDASGGHSVAAPAEIRT